MCRWESGGSNDGVISDSCSSPQRIGPTQIQRSGSGCYQIGYRDDMVTWEIIVMDSLVSGVVDSRLLIIRDSMKYV
ncbi:MAG: hypothetical protein WAM14_02985 [Candidatus Nitrosopolaris sp.]